MHCCTYTHSNKLHIYRNAWKSENEKKPNETSNRQHWCDLLFSPHKYMRRLNCANNEMESSSVCCNRFACDAPSLAHIENACSPFDISRMWNYATDNFLLLNLSLDDGTHARTHTAHTISASIDLLFQFSNIFAFCTRLLSHPFITWHFVSEWMKWNEANFWRSAASDGHLLYSCAAILFD